MMKENKGTMIMYSWSTIWSMKNKSGAPSFYKTIDLYVKKGWDVNLILTDASKGAEEMPENCRVFTLKEWKTDRMISSKLSSKPFLLIKMLRYFCFSKKVTKEIMEQKKENVLFYAYEIHGVSSAKWASEKYRRPLVTRFQGTVATYFKDDLATKVKQYFHLKALKTKADLVIMTDDGTKGLETLQKLGNPSENIMFWRNGLDLLSTEYSITTNVKHELREKLGISDDECMLLTVSRLQSWKRVDRAINVLAEIVKTSSKFKLVIAGDGPEKSKLESMVDDYQLNNSVIFLGAVDHEKVYDYMSAADIFLSLYDMSNVGNPLLEALTLGKCVVTLDVGDTAKLITNEENGIIVDVKAIFQLPKLVMQIYNDAEKRKKMEKNAEEYAKEYFYSWDERMEMEYKEVLKIL